MRIHVLQHSEGTPPGTVIDWAKAKGHALNIVKLHAGEPLPRVDETDWVIVLGGAMNVDDHENYPWLAPEKAFVRQVIDEKKTCLGLCLGGQVIARALGAAVRPHTEWEVGWHPIFMGHDRLMAFQFHQDTFDIPAGATKVAMNRVCENQGFAYSDCVVGLQFHPEATEEWVRECTTTEPYPTGAHVQKPEQILEDLVFQMPMRKWFFSLLDRMEGVTQQKLHSHRA